MYCFLLYDKHCSVLSSFKKYTISSINIIIIFMFLLLLKQQQKYIENRAEIERKRKK